MFDFDPHQIEEHFAQDAIFKGENWPRELKFDMQAVFDSHFHLNGFVRAWWVDHWIKHYELFFLGYSIVVPVDYHIDIVSKHTRISINDSAYLKRMIIPLYVSNFFSTLLNEKLYSMLSVNDPGGSNS